MHGAPILPAGQILFGKTNVSLSRIPSEWPTGTVVVCKKPNGRLHFVAGCSGSYFPVGSHQRFSHDQTGADFGKWLVVNEVQYKTVDGQVQWDPVVPFDNQINPSTIAAIAVFK